MEVGRTEQSFRGQRRKARRIEKTEIGNGGEEEISKNKEER